MAKKLTPKTANTFNKICQLSRDNIHTTKSWLMVGEKTVDICNQKSGEKSIGIVTISKKDFERFIKFYETGR